ncbi:hypothetical protein ACRZ36_002293 [Serratia liquefaciens]
MARGLGSGITNGVVGVGKTNSSAARHKGVASVAEVGKHGDDLMNTFDHEKYLFVILITKFYACAIASSIPAAD